MKRSRIASLALLLVPLSLAAAPAAPSLESMFPRRASVNVERAGIARLALPQEVLSNAQADLSDVRLLDAAGAEIPYVVDEGGPAYEGPAVTAMPEVLDVRRQIGPTREREFRPSRFEETYRLRIPRDPDSGAWTLEVVPSRSEFVARARVEDVATGESAVAPIFELASLPRARTSIEIPGGPGPREVVLVLETADGYLSPALTLRARGAREGAEQLEVVLPVTRESRERGATVYSLDRPAGLVPGSLRVTSATPWFDRAVEVWDEGAGSGESLLGSGHVARIDTGVVVVEELDVDVRGASGDRLRVRIADGDSPPLERIAFTAVVARPALLFHATVAGTPVATLVFGGNRVRPPRYEHGRLR